MLRATDTFTAQVFLNQFMLQIINSSDGEIKSST